MPTNYSDYPAPWEFIIDTDSYAGNFERELCAYVTGHWDMETHGGDQAEMFEQEVGLMVKEVFEDAVMFLPTCDDDVPINACECVEDAPGPDGRCNSVGIFFSEKPTPEMVAFMKERALKFVKEGKVFDKPQTDIKNITGFRLLQRVVSYNCEDV